MSNLLEPFSGSFENPPSEVSLAAHIADVVVTIHLRSDRAVQVRRDKPAIILTLAQREDEHPSVRDRRFISVTVGADDVPHPSVNRILHGAQPKIAGSALQSNPQARLSPDPSTTPCDKPIVRKKGDQFIGVAGAPMPLVVAQHALEPWRQRDRGKRVRWRSLGRMGAELAKNLAQGPFTAIIDYHSLEDKPFAAVLQH